MTSRNINNLRRLHKKITIKELISEEVVFSYEQAIQFSVEKINEAIKTENKKNSELDMKFDELPTKNEPSEEQLDILISLSEIEHTKFILEAQKFSLKEMQIIHLFKSYEIFIKEIIKVAFPNENRKELFRWEAMTGFFKMKKIEFSKINEYQSIYQLKIVNNNIKHSSEIDAKIKETGIPEFNGLENFDYESLNKFYERVKPCVTPFLHKVADNIISHLFDYSEERILGIAESYSEKMDDNTLQRLAKALEKESRASNSFPVMGDWRL